LFAVGFMIDWVFACCHGCTKWLVYCLGMLMCLLQVKTVASTDKLAQVSWSRLGKINRGSPKLFFPRMVAQATHYIFERANVSLRRGESRLSENACKATVLEVELSPRRRELAWARVLLAWARPFCLSEKLGEKVVGLDVFLDFKCWQYACMGIIFKNMN